MARRKKQKTELPVTQGRGTVEQVDELHGLLAKILLRALRHSHDTGQPLTPRMLAVVIAFLKLNGINRPAKELQSIDYLAHEMPDFSAMDDEQRTSNVLPFDPSSH